MAEPTATETDEAKSVTRWRQRCARDLGFDPHTASRIARNTHMDLHELERLIRRGCDRKLAYRIVR